MKRLITIKGICKNNLDIKELTLPHNKTILLVGPSGSGKSTLARDIIFKEGQRFYLEGLGLGHGIVEEAELDEVPVQSISGIPPTLYLDQVPQRVQGSTDVGAFTLLTPLLHLLFTLKGVARCPRCKSKIPFLPPAGIRDAISKLAAGTRIIITTPISRAIPHTEKKAVLEWILRQGFVRIYLDGRQILVEEALNATHDLDLARASLVLDRVVVKKGIGARIDDAVRIVESMGTKVLSFELAHGGRESDATGRRLLFSIDNTCPKCLTSYPKLSPRLFSRRNEAGQCPECKGKGCENCNYSGLGPFPFAVEVAGMNLVDIKTQRVKELIPIFEEIADEETSSYPLLISVIETLKALSSIGLGYLTLNRRLKAISRGEFQRLRLVRAVQKGLSGIMVILDEPTIGLHPKDYSYLKRLIIDLKAAGNTVLVIDHDPWFAELADWITLLGPGSGSDGGRIVFNGPKEDALWPQSKVPAAPIKHATAPWGSLRVDEQVAIPLGGITMITGISGSGKTRYAFGPVNQAFKKRGISVLSVDQAQLRGNPWAMIATYIGIFTPIRELFARTKEARLKGLSPASFSLSKKGGRCEVCKGTGHRTLDLNHLGSLKLLCDSCGGLRYKEAILTCTYRGRNIADVLALTAKEALAFFSRIPRVRKPLEILISSGLGYLTLGQALSSLSGGEAMRLRLINAFPKKLNTHSTLRDRALVLDEPSAGLAQDDLVSLLQQLQGLQERGLTIVVIDHERIFQNAADLVIELGPGAGPRGGSVVKIDHRRIVAPK